MAAHKDTVPRIIELLKDTFQGAPFKEFYDGDPELIPDFNLPCLIVTLTGDEVNMETYGTDLVKEQVVIKVVLNQKDDLDADDRSVNPLDMTEKKIRDIIGAIDPATGYYREQTIKRALREHLSEENMIIDGPMTVTLGIRPRPGQDVWTSEGHVQVSVQYSVNVEHN